MDLRTRARKTTVDVPLSESVPLVNSQSCSQQGSCARSLSLARCVNTSISRAVYFYRYRYRIP